MIFATAALATAEFCSMSDIVRRALAEELMSRGYMQEREEAAAETKKRNGGTPLGRFGPPFHHESILEHE
jgi:Arc/MetJ-type ribon-helix-helix transcriptional regulator